MVHTVAAILLFDGDDCYPDLNETSQCSVGNSCLVDTTLDDRKCREDCQHAKTLSHGGSSMKRNPYSCHRKICVRVYNQHETKDGRLEENSARQLVVCYRECVVYCDVFPGEA